MAAVDWTGPIGTGPLAVVTDVDNVSPTDVMFSDFAGGTTKTQYENITGGDQGDSGIEAEIKLEYGNNQGTGLSAFLGLRSQSTAEDSDRYEAEINYLPSAGGGGPGAMVALDLYMRRINSTVATTIAYRRIEPADFNTHIPAGIIVGGDADFNRWRFDVKDGAAGETRLRLMIAPKATSSFSTLMEVSDTAAGRFDNSVTPSRGRFGALTQKVVMEMRMDDVEFFSLP